MVYLTQSYVAIVIISYVAIVIISYYTQMQILAASYAIAVYV